MKEKFRLPEKWIEQVAKMRDFANGGVQVTIRTTDGTLFPKVLISASTWIAAVRGFKQLPFNPMEIAEITQSEEDINPLERGGWDWFW